MRKQSSIIILSVIAVLLSVATSWADYSNTVVSLNPVAYWPLNETVQPPQAYVATNSGTLGSLGNGYYETWFNPSGNGYVQQMDWTGPVPGATGDGDGAASFTGNGNRYIQIPHTSSAINVKPPFSVECWAYVTNVNDWENLVGAGGQYNRSASASGNEAGFSLVSYYGSWHFDLYNTNGGNYSIELSTPSTATQWTHLVATYDGTNANLYVNGNEVATAPVPTNSAGLGYVPDMVNPIIIGRLNPEKYSNALQGLIDEIAIYTNLLSPTDVANHYSAAAGTGYAAAVTANNPLIYLRLGEPLYNLPASNTFASFPPAVNYGSIGSAANGLYQPGTVPGLPGPAGAGFGSANYSVAINGMNSAVDVGNGNLTGVAPALNVTGTNALSVVAWYKGPADGYNRFQTILGHGDSGWRFGLSSSGPQFNPGSGGEISSSDAYNDSRWHMVVGVYDSKSNYIYIDSKLINSTAYSGSQSGSSRDVLLGGAPDYTTPIGRYWAGRLAQVSFFTNALSATNIAQLYNAAEIIPYITTQPLSANVNAGSAYTNIVAVAGSPTFSYQWYFNGNPATDQTNLNLGFNPVQGANAGNYYEIISNAGGSVTSSVVTLTVNTSPQITTQPATNYVLFVGGSVTFKPVASGALPIYYYWSSNSVVVAATTNANYTLANASTSATYTCLVSNFLGNVSTYPITVSVIPRPTTAYPQVVLTNGPIAYYRLDEADDGNLNEGATAYDYVGGHNGIYTNVALGVTGYPANPSDADTAASFSSITLADSYMQIPDIDFSTVSGSNAEFSVEAWVNGVAGGQKSDGSGIITKGTGGGGEQFNLDTGAANGAFRFFVRDAAGGVHLANSSIVPDNNWHHLVGVCDEINGHVNLYVDGLLAASTTIGVASGLKSSTHPVSIGSRQSGTSGSYNDQFYGIIDEVAIYNYALSQSQVATDYGVTGVAPFIAKQPANTTVQEGLTATFSATIGGSAPLGIQWYDVTSGFPGTPISGATSNILTLLNVTAAQNGTMYAVVATNLYGQATSTAAQLTVLSGPPTLVTDISPLYIKSFTGMHFTFTVSVTGSQPIHYQWNQSGSPVGANTNTYTVTVLQGTNTYNCTITNINGSISSSTATVVGVAITDSGTNTATSSTTFAVNFMDAANGAYTADGGSTWTNIVYQGLGAYPDAPANTNWNGFGMFPNGSTGTFNSTTIPQLASDGTLTPVTLSLVYGFDSGYLGYGPGYAGNTGPTEPSMLIGECAVVNGSNPVGNITISNVPPGTYTLYLYSANADNDRGGTFNFSSGSPLGGTNVVINSAPGTGPASNLVYGVTYIIFTGVAPDANGTITGTWGAVNNPNSGNTGEGNFNGLQLVRVSGPTATPPILTIQLSGVDTIISWSPTNGVLQSATSLTGTFTDIGGANSPYTNSVSGDQQFFRVKVP